MSAILEKSTYSANDEHDTVLIRVHDLRARVPYRVGFEIDQALRMMAKTMAQCYGAPGSFWRELALPDLADCPKPYRKARQSRHLPSYKKWEVQCNPPLVGLFFDGRGREFDLEMAVTLGHEIRRASRRAKAWAGDNSRHVGIMANLTDANTPTVVGVTH